MTLTEVTKSEGILAWLLRRVSTAAKTNRSRLQRGTISWCCLVATVSTLQRMSDQLNLHVCVCVRMRARARVCVLCVLRACVGNKTVYICVSMRVYYNYRATRRWIFVVTGTLPQLYAEFAHHSFVRQRNEFVMLSSCVREYVGG